jgi:hypothetical protein
MIRKILGLSLLCAFSFNAHAQATDDNEINIDQTGDTLTLYVDQYGYGNKIGLDNFSTGSSAMPITGSSLTFNMRTCSLVLISVTVQLLTLYLLEILTLGIGT